MLNIEEFMKLPDEEKKKYINRTYPSGVEKKNDFVDHGVGVYADGGKGSEDYCEFMSCQFPDATESECSQGKRYGTDDGREPRFCETHWKEVNKDSEFYPIRKPLDRDQFMKA
jgi:hypothetical protein